MLKLEKVIAKEDVFYKNHAGTHKVCTKGNTYPVTFQDREAFGIRSEFRTPHFFDFSDCKELTLVYKR
jgi:hypothetical protein